MSKHQRQEQPPPAGRRIGYARVSTEEQNLDLQHDALKAAGCATIFEDKICGRTDSRPGLDAALTELRPGDSLVVWKLDRLGRSTLHLVQTVNALRERGVEFVSIMDSIDTGGIMGKFVFHIFAALAELERDQIAARTKAGLAATMARGQHVGRPHSIPPDKVEAARARTGRGEYVKDIAAEYGVDRRTLADALRRPPDRYYAPKAAGGEP